MKKAFLHLAVFLAGFLLLVPETDAHLSGQPPFFKINGVYSDIYPVQAGRNNTILTFPQDIGPTSYLVNEPIEFLLDPKTIPYPTESLSQLIFEWDFGDGTKATGLQNTHSYKKPGTYEIVVNTKTPTSDQAFLLQDTFVHIKPTKDYQIPKPVILINGKKASDYPLKFAQADLSRPVTLSVELPENVNIASYTWDLDDGSKKTETSFTHTFPPGRSVVTPLLRVVDEYGIISDIGEPIVNKKGGDTISLPWIILLGIPVLVTIAGSFIILKKRRRKS